MKNVMDIEGVRDAALTALNHAYNEGFRAGREYEATKAEWGMSHTDSNRLKENIKGIIDAGYTLEEIGIVVEHMKEN